MIFYKLSNSFIIKGMVIYAAISILLHFIFGLTIPQSSNLYILSVLALPYLSHKFMYLRHVHKNIKDDYLTTDFTGNIPIFSLFQVLILLGGSFLLTIEKLNSNNYFTIIRYLYSVLVIIFLFNIFYNIYLIFRLKKVERVDFIQHYFITYFGVGGAFAVIYSLIPNALEHNTNPSTPVKDIIDFIYFSFVTLATTGYGDIIPSDPLTKVYVVIENAMGLFLTGFLIAMIFESKGTIEKK